MSKPRIEGSAPILLVRDVMASANYYHEEVGFEIQGTWGDPPNFCILCRDDFHLMLSRVEDEQVIRPHYQFVENMWNVYFWVSDVDAIYNELKGRGATIDNGLCDKPYGCREFGIQDLDGYDSAFGQDIAASDHT